MKFVDFIGADTIAKHVIIVDQIMKDIPSRTLEDAWSVVPIVMKTKEELKERFG